ncbi:MAG: hypothetical protein J0H06_01580 [Actinobacteria bacterium]|nr:hypothetical protein [Actinomycetota bacterium]OJU80541.1 MAG: hypothetical protein BGO11_07390 [Solirubrobacterales bacterium 70-9]
MPETHEIATAYLDAFFAGETQEAARHLAAGFEFEGPLSSYDTIDSFLVGSEPFLQSLRPGWRRVSSFSDDREALFLYELKTTDGKTIRVANQLIFEGGLITRETVVFDSRARRVDGRHVADLHHRPLDP